MAEDIPVPVVLWMGTIAILVSPDDPERVVRGLRDIVDHLRIFSLHDFTVETAREIAKAKRFGFVPGWDVISPIMEAAREARHRACIAERERLAAPKNPRHKTEDRYLTDEEVWQTMAESGL